MPVILALDVGSTFAKAQPFDERGCAAGPVTRAAVPVEDDGTADAEAFLAAVELVVDDALGRGGPAVKAVALTCSWHGLVGLDAGGRPATSLSTFMDTRAARESVELRDRLSDPAAVEARTGAHLHPSFPPARLLWLARHRPDTFAAVARWCTIAELLQTRWMGPDVGVSPSMASGTGLYDSLAGAWDGEMLKAAGVSAHTLAPVDAAPHMGLGAVYRTRWPALADVPWLPAVGDGAASVVGSDCLRPGRAALTVGTSAAVRLAVTPELRRHHPPPRSLFVYLLDPARHVVGAARSNAGNLAEWAQGVLRLDQADPVEAAVTGRRPWAHGLRADPSLAGERSPDWPAEATAAISGLRSTTDALDLLQALLESAVAGLAGSVAAVEGWAGGLDLVLSGGAARSPGWQRLLADGLDRPLIMCTAEEVSARGAALMALETLGWISPDGFDPVDGDVVQPDPHRARAFAQGR